MTRAYLDNAATTKIDPLVLESMMPYFKDVYANPSTIYGSGRAARKAIEDARDLIANAIGATPQEIVFTSSATEANNTAIFGVANNNKKREMVVSSIEHESVLASVEVLAKNGFRVKKVNVDSSCLISLDSLRQAINNETILVSLMLVNNETGTIQPIKKMADIVHENGILLHVDAVQALGKIRVDVNELGTDILTLSSHKIHGPRGAGLLYLRKGVQISPILYGGGQEFQKRSGTENTPGIIGFAKAVEIALENLDKTFNHVKKLKEKLVTGLKRMIKDITINASENSVPHIVNMSFNGADGEALIMSLDQRGVCVSSGSACASLSMELSHVLTAMGLDRNIVRSALRFSLSRFTSEEEIGYTLEALPPIVEKLRSISPLYE